MSSSMFNFIVPQSARLPNLDFPSSIETQGLTNISRSRRNSPSEAYCRESEMHHWARKLSSRCASSASRTAHGLPSKTDVDHATGSCFTMWMDRDIHVIVYSAPSEKYSLRKPLWIRPTEKQVNRGVSYIWLCVRYSFFKLFTLFLLFHFSRFMKSRFLPKTQLFVEASRISYRSHNLRFETCEFRSRKLSFTSATERNCSDPSKSMINCTEKLVYP